MKSNKLIFFEDLIGKKVHARSLHDPHWQEFRPMGIVVDETKYTLITAPSFKDSQEKLLLKKHYQFQIEVKREHKTEIFEIMGSALIGHPEQRIKSIRKKRLKVI